MKMRENIWVKMLAFLLAVVSFSLCTVLGWYQLFNLDVLWGDTDAGSAASVRNLEYQDLTEIRNYISLRNDEDLNKSLGTYSQQYKAELEEYFDPENTNLRWYAVSEDGETRYGNTDLDVPERASGFLWSEYTWESMPFGVNIYEEANWYLMASGAVNLPEHYQTVADINWKSEILDARNAYVADGTAVSESGGGRDRNDEAPTVEVDKGEEITADTTGGDDVLDTVYMDENYTTDVLVIWYSDEKYVYGPTVRTLLGTNEFGYIWNDGWSQDGSGEHLVSKSMDIYLWLEDGLPVWDSYAKEVMTLQGWKVNRGAALAAAAALLCLGIVLTVFLMAACGHKRGHDGIWLNWFHRIPGDLMLICVSVGVLMLCVLASDSYYWIGKSGYPNVSFLQEMMLGLMAAVIAALVIGYLITFAARCKGHTILRNTIVWRLCAWIGRGCFAVLSAIPLIWKVLAVGAVYGLGVLLFRRSEGLMFLLWLAAFGFLCVWAAQWAKVRAGTKKILSGQRDEKIDTRWMFPDLKDHAEELNNLGETISAAVDERMRSERFKAELITNVSHDLKTPLTSIINYVDLLKKEQIEDPAVQEYIEVLDRKSQRLKKLTEDLVEASKASTGNLAVLRERIGLTQLADQALAEYEERLSGKNLRVIRSFPEKEVWAEGDGRHLWRVLDNLLSNCAKYALEGTRIYVEVSRAQEWALLSVKNISRDPLNVPPEALVERFVRGDESRTTEGSGLGLSIAQSLTELQGGRFQVTIDGDLFKAEVALPFAEDDPDDPELLQ